jgi:hypothetical protein
MSSLVFVDATGRWDDGQKVRDKPWSLTLQCSRCGSRPRPEHDFRCRQHDDELENAEERPEQPSLQRYANDKDGYERALRLYKQQMDEWTPEWIEKDEDETPSSELDKDRTYPLPCVRCDGQLELCGRAGGGFSQTVDEIKKVTPWLASWYASGVGVGWDGRFDSALGQFGQCRKCQLHVGIEPGEDGQ